jgi:hypothetical protein
LLLLSSSVISSGNPLLRLPSGIFPTFP